jgi:hypothetical protein
VAADPKISWPWTVSIVKLPERRFAPGDVEETRPARGEADNAGDGFLFGGERHDRAAPFAGRVGLDAGGVAHFAFVSFGWLTTIVRSAFHSPTRPRR